jgi:hypothetical protein
MVYRGRIDGGALVLDGGERLPDGTIVDVVPVEPKAATGDTESLYRLDELAVPTGIADLAVNIDHYLYGHPKVDDAQR